MHRRMVLSGAFAALLLSGVRAGAQETFDVAAVKAGRLPDGATLVPGGFLPGGRWSAQGATLPMLASHCDEVIRMTNGGALRFQLRDRPLADFLILTGARTEIGYPVVEQTGLTGRFDLDLEFVPQGDPALD